MSKDNNSGFSRRKFLGTGLLGAAGVGLSPFHYHGIGKAHFHDFNKGRHPKIGFYWTGKTKQWFDE